MLVACRIYATLSPYHSGNAARSGIRSAQLFLDQDRRDIPEALPPARLGQPHEPDPHLVCGPTHFVREGKHYVTVGIGCTGGRHRSVVLAEELKQWLAARGDVEASVRHRDVDR